MKLLESALQDLARGEISDLDAFFHVVETGVTVKGTSASCHIHCINLDGNGRPRVDALVKNLLGHVLDYSIPRKRIDEAIADQLETKSTFKVTRLLLEAMASFSKLKNSGEGGELILWLMAERFLKLPQLICKMNLKTSTQMHFHGADGLHAGVDTVTERLCLYWGESKIYSNINAAVNSCMKSIAPLLLGEGGVGSAEERDLQLLGQFLNIEDEKLENALKSFLDPDSKSFNQVEFRGLCLVGFDSDSYPAGPNIETVKQVTDSMTKQITKWQDQIEKCITKEKLALYSIHVFLLPFPSVSEFRKSFKAALSPSHVS